MLIKIPAFCQTQKTTLKMYIPAMVYEEIQKLKSTVTNIYCIFKCRVTQIYSKKGVFVTVGSYLTPCLIL